MSLRSEALDYIKNNYDFYQGILQDFIKIPSISTDPNRKPNMLEAANFIKEILNEFGIQDVQILETKGHPVVFAEKKSASKDALTVLIYGHYDVQPSDPIELWDTDPFTPTIRNDRLFGRGASDMKGQIIASLTAYHAINSIGPIPVSYTHLTLPTNREV